MLLQVIDQVVRTCPIDCRRPLYNNIVLSVSALLTILGIINIIDLRWAKYGSRLLLQHEVRLYALCHQHQHALAGAFCFLSGKIFLLYEQ